MIYLGLKTLLFLTVLVRTSLGFAADSAAMLTVTTENAHLYASQDSEGKAIATLQRGEVLGSLAQSIGFATWYMVKTSKGVVGWIQAVDVASTQRIDEVFRDRSEVHAKDVTPEAQVERNRENEKKVAEANRAAEADRARAEQRAAAQRRAEIQADATIEAARERRPDVTINREIINREIIIRRK